MNLIVDFSSNLSGVPQDLHLNFPIPALSSLTAVFKLSRLAPTSFNLSKDSPNCWSLLAVLVNPFTRCRSGSRRRSRSRREEAVWRECLLHCSGLQLSVIPWKCADRPAAKIPQNWQDIEDFEVINHRSMAPTRRFLVYAGKPTL